MPIRAILIATIVTLGLSRPSLAAKDWIFDDGAYTVDPTTGKRVDQFKKKVVPTAVPYDEYFSPNGAGAYIPWGYYQQNLGIGFGYGGGYGGYAGGYGYGGAYGFGSAYPAFGGYAF